MEPMQTISIQILVHSHYAQPCSRPPHKDATSEALTSQMLQTSMFFYDDFPEGGSQVARSAEIGIL